MARWRRIKRFPFWLAVAGITTAIVLYVFGLPHLQARLYPLVRPADLIIPRAIDMVVVVWCFWVGSSVGSFLNVVAWRMPRGESINGRSHCPRCLAQLRARDNLPVFGWLALGGRCYQCRLPISIRYPIVEGAVGLTITAVCIAEIYQLSLPGQFVHVHQGPLRAPIVDLGILLTVLYHCVAVANAWACGLIRLDGNRLPKRLVAFAMASLIVPILALPELAVVPWQTQPEVAWQPSNVFLDAIFRVVTAVVAATILGRYLARTFCPDADPKLDPLGRSTQRLMDLIVILGIPAIVVGWQAVIAVTVVASLITVVLQGCLRVPREILGRFAISVPIALAIQLVFWRHLHAPLSIVPDFIVQDLSGTVLTGTRYWPSDGSSPWVLLSWAGLVLLIPLWLRDRDSISDDDDPVPEDGVPEDGVPEDGVPEDGQQGLEKEIDPEPASKRVLDSPGSGWPDLDDQSEADVESDRESGDLFRDSDERGDDR